MVTSRRAFPDMDPAPGCRLVEPRRSQDEVGIIMIIIMIIIIIIIINGTKLRRVPAGCDMLLEKIQYFIVSCSPSPPVQQGNCTEKQTNK